MERLSAKALYKNKELICVLLIMIIGITIRIVDFGNTPFGLNQDEAYAGYEAFSMLNYGVDSWGNHNPVYFISWGSGMNVLQSYLAIPFIMLFGCSATVIRLPQLIISCISLAVFYLLIRKVFSVKTALIGLGLAVISPWHIMMSRWALESNLAPSFLLFGLYFFIKGISDNRWWLLSALMYGLSFYTYSITWIIVPLTVVLCGVFVLFSKKKIRFGYMAASCGILFVFAVPLILFLLVNKGIIPEISTSFISIPKLAAMRDHELSLSNLFNAETYKKLFSVLILQNDNLPWNSTKKFGLFYQLSVPFIVFGIVRLIIRAVKSIKAKTFSYEIIILVGMLCSLFTCLLMTDLNVNRTNSLHFYSLIFLTVGVADFFALFKNRIARCVIPSAVLVCYAVMFMFFMHFYFTDYNETIAYNFRPGLGEAVEFVNEKEFDDVCVDSDFCFALILFYDKTPSDVWLDTVKYNYYPSAFMNVKTFAEFTFGIDDKKIGSHKAYIIKTRTYNNFVRKGYEIAEFGDYCVAYMP